MLRASAGRTEWYYKYHAIDITGLILTGQRRK